MRLPFRTLYHRYAKMNYTLNGRISGQYLFRSVLLALIVFQKAFSTEIGFCANLVLKAAYMSADKPEGLFV
jgi:hypothetical protein